MIQWKQFFIRLLRLLLGLLLYAVGIVVTLNARIGYAPWDVFHVGFAKTTGISIGTASIIAGAVIGIVAVLLGEKLGLGTILNMVLIGVFLDLILRLSIIPQASNFVLGTIMLIIGLFIIALASYFYIGSAFGAGPRDSLMVALTRKTKLSVGVCRGTIELLAVLAGWMLGGMVGFGTILSAFAIGFCVQTTFKLLKFDAAEIQHETFVQTYKQFTKSKECQLSDAEGNNEPTICDQAKQ
ncbi:YczE/YyaS/YitT family protein [Anoxybacterium hadale]|uniref:YczE/YyaS/YitT family protein n=1 Tax=Anoxybacterium hadale TaxID=3408580 RepID=UPI003B00BC4C